MSGSLLACTAPESSSTVPEQSTLEIPEDINPQEILSVSVFETTEDSVTIKWETAHPSTSQIAYDRTLQLELLTPLDKELKTVHIVKLTDLDINTSYYYKIISTDANGNLATSTSKTPCKTNIVQIGTDVGELAPDFTLKDIEGNDVTLSSFQKKKIVFINVWYIACAPCVVEMPKIQNVYQNWSGNKELAILAINRTDRLEKVKKWVKEKGFKFTFLMGNSNVEFCKVRYFPTSYFINLNGVIKRVKAGQFASEADMLDILKSL